MSLKSAVLQCSDIDIRQCFSARLPYVVVGMIMLIDCSWSSVGAGSGCVGVGSGLTASAEADSSTSGSGSCSELFFRDSSVVVLLISCFSSDSTPNLLFF